VTWLDGQLGIPGLTRWAPGIYLLRVQATLRNGTVRVFPVVKLAVKR
jgi:hypothetical protein